MGKLLEMSVHTNIGAFKMKTCWEENLAIHHRRNTMKCCECVETKLIIYKSA